MNAEFKKYCQLAKSIEIELAQHRASALQVSRADEAYQFYQRAATHAQSDTEREQVFRSIADVLISKLRFYSANPDYCKDFWDKMGEVVQKISYWCGNLLFKSGRNTYFKDIDEKKLYIESELKRFVVGKDYHSRFEPVFLRALAQGADVTCCGYKAFHALKWAEHLFKNGVKCLEIERDAKQAKNWFHNMYTPLQLCQSAIVRSKRIGNLGRDEANLIRDLEKEVGIKEDEQLLETRRSEALLLLVKANKYHQELIYEKQFVTIEDFLSVYDIYHQILILVRCVDIELEALIYSKMGVYQLKILRFPNGQEKSREYFRKCLELAESLKPKNVTNEPWYNDAVVYLRELQQKAMQKESMENKVLREQFVEELKGVRRFLEAVELDLEGEQNLGDILANILRQFKPRADFNQSKFLNSPNKKKLHMMLQAYSSESNQNQGGLWMLICEDISAYLNKQLERTKESSE